MQQSTLTTAGISIVLAVGLFLIASWFEDDGRWQLVTTADAPTASFAPPREDTPLRTTDIAGRCDRSEAVLVEKVDAAQSCSTDDDCTIFDYGYPIQCLTSVSKSHITALRLEYRQYEQNCPFRVYYDCPTGAMERMPVCRNNRCAVNLVTTDFLQDETLDHLGIKER